MTNLWEIDDPIIEITDDVDVPEWISQDITPADVAAIRQGGCASGAYMPAVRYCDARNTMNEHGSDVLQFIEDTYGDELPAPPTGSSGVVVFYLSAAVEAWASQVEGELAEALAVEEPCEGTVIEGTTRPQDIIPALLAEYERIAPKTADNRRFIDEAEAITPDVDDHEDWHSDRVQDLYVDLLDRLDGLAPQDCYFGSHPGDGADLGFWPYDDEEG